MSPLTAIFFHHRGSKPLTRFAPSPTGHLHIGHVAHALFVWGIAQRLGAQIVLRIEDHDRARSRAEFESSILQDLAWLGLRPDFGLDAQGRVDPDYRQSTHPSRYQDALDRLVASGAHLYGCNCSRKDIQQAASAPAGAEPRYPGTCRDRGIPISPGVGIRLQLPTTSETFRDGLSGDAHAQRPSEQCGDLLLRDRDGFWTYQFAVTVDDLHDRINLIIRGADLLSSTGRQLTLRRLLGDQQQPYFVHHPLIHDPTGRKLGKRDGATAIAERRAAGQMPAQVLGEAAHLVGLQSQATPIDATDLGRFF